LQSGANAGLLTHAGRGILIDCGLDADAGRRIAKTIDSLGVTLDALILTHGHADHFGGAAYLRGKLPPFTVYAPALERAFIENPLLEGVMLSAGAVPFDQLRSKFTLAPACIVDRELTVGALSVAGLTLEIISLAGHSPNQMGVRIDDVFFTADAFLPEATLKKYPIPFTAHFEQALATLAMLGQSTDVLIAPGHGMHLRDARPTIQANREALLRIVDTVAATIRVEPLNEAEVTERVARALQESLATSVSYYLARATIQAALVFLYEQGRAETLHNGQLKWAGK
jgi:glyoxylase-like metal-dependent hydrolase (beta-lactamase superfamily II)